MKVLWITNVLLPEIKGILTGDNSIKMSGGWLSAMAMTIVDNDSMDLYVATVCDYIKSLTRIEGNRIHYYLLPKRSSHNKYDEKLEQDWRAINSQIHPDIVHIHGTEYPYGLSYVRSCGTNNVIASLQGVVSEIAKYCKGGLSNWDIIRHVTLRDLVLRDSVFAEVRQMKINSRYEVELLGRINHIIGRTDWDKAHAISINRTINYYHCDENLRDTFYTGQWSYKTCKAHSIFVSQAHCPAKGFHILLRAVALLKKTYPDICVRVSGWNIFKGNSFVDKFKQTGYANYLQRLMDQYNIRDCVTMIGFLDATGIKNELLNSNVYVCPSSIENSPNSLCEAQILGVPCVAPYVGGIPTIMKNNIENLYRYDDWRYLAFLLAKVFESQNPSTEYVRQEALNRHSQHNNALKLLKIYHSVLADA